jgi:hypothetical protein
MLDAVYKGKGKLTGPHWLYGVEFLLIDWLGRRSLA